MCTDIRDIKYSKIQWIKAITKTKRTCLYAFIGTRQLARVVYQQGNKDWSAGICIIPEAIEEPKLHYTTFPSQNKPGPTCVTHCNHEKLFLPQFTTSMVRITRWVGQWRVRTNGYTFQWTLKQIVYQYWTPLTQVQATCISVIQSSRCLALVDSLLWRTSINSVCL